ncbi:hypothetical protein ACR79N_15100 [Sphingobacterium siyangense]|uniref:hypothetical protein n=1 Tax=Sphingobacterium siyangense TaxID=459529 RepID=UPI003DA3B730
MRQPFFDRIKKTTTMISKKIIKNNKRWFSASTLATMVGIATLTFAFKPDVKDSSNHNANKVFATKWYQYNGSGSRTAESNYTLLSTQPANETEAANLCPNVGEICVINAPEGSGMHPASFSTAFKNEINNAQASGVETTNVKLRD